MRRVLYACLVVVVLGLGGAVGSSCADTSSGDGDQGATPADASAEVDMAPAGCFMGVATTEPQLLNHCTDAERVERPHRVPTTVWDGKGALPPAP